MDRPVEMAPTRECNPCDAFSNHPVPEPRRGAARGGTGIAAEGTVAGSVGSNRGEIFRLEAGGRGRETGSRAPVNPERNRNEEPLRCIAGSSWDISA